VDTLTLADRIAVLTFDTQVERSAGLAPGLAAASDRHRFRAVEHLAAATAFLADDPDGLRAVLAYRSWWSWSHRCQKVVREVAAGVWRS
jgi:hypothetical protein